MNGSPPLNPLGRYLDSLKIFCEMEGQRLKRKVHLVRISDGVGHSPKPPPGAPPGARGPSFL